MCTNDELVTCSVPGKLFSVLVQIQNSGKLGMLCQRSRWLQCGVFKAGSNFYALKVKRNTDYN